MDRFEYCLTKSVNPKNKFKLKPRSAYFGDGATQSQAGTVAATSDSLPSPHQITPPPCIDVENHAHASVELSHSPTPPTLVIYVDLACKPTSCHMESFPQPLSPHSIDR